MKNIPKPFSNAEIDRLYDNRDLLDQGGSAGIKSKAAFNRSVRFIEDLHNLKSDIKEQTFMALIENELDNIITSYNGMINYAVDHLKTKADVFIGCWREGDWDSCREFGFKGALPVDFKFHSLGMDDIHGMTYPLLDSQIKYLHEKHEQHEKSLNKKDIPSLEAFSKLVKLVEKTHQIDGTFDDLVDVEAKLSEMNAARDSFNSAIDHSIDLGLDSYVFLTYWRMGDGAACRQFEFNDPLPGETVKSQSLPLKLKGVKSPDMT